MYQSSTTIYLQSLGTSEAPGFMVPEPTEWRRYWTSGNLSSRVRIYNGVYTLRSCSSELLLVSEVKTNIGTRAFVVITAAVWKMLPSSDNHHHHAVGREATKTASIT